MTTADTPAVHSLDDLLRKVSPPPEVHLQAILGAASREQFTRWGADTASGRIVVDTTRIYSQALEFCEKATPARLRQVVGFSRPLLAAGIHQAAKLRDAQLAVTAGVGAGAAGKDELQRTARAEFSRGLVLREQAERALRGVAGKDPALSARVINAVGLAEDHEQLASGLEGLAGVLRGFLQSADPNVRLRVELGSLDVAYADDLEAAARRVRESGRAAGGARTGMIDQGELDFLDGVNLHILSEIIHAFEAAHDLDPTIPKLVPIATRRALGKRKRVAAEKPAPTPTPVPA